MGILRCGMLVLMQVSYMIDLESKFLILWRWKMKTREHRGTDIGSALGTHLHVGSSGPNVGDVGFWNGTTWSSLAPTASTVDLTTEFVNSWANKLAPNDNDIIQLRKKNGIIYAMKVEPHANNKWEKLDPKAIPVVTDIHGAKLEDVDLATLRNELIPSEEPSIPIPHMEIGWYQDNKADLFYYEGEGHWREVDLKTNKKLTEMVVAGTLEFIG
jgi:hypothetical protein